MPTSRAYLPPPAIEELLLEQRAPLLAVWNACQEMERVLQEQVADYYCRQSAMAHLATIYARSFLAITGRELAEDLPLPSLESPSSPRR